MIDLRLANEEAGFTDSISAIAAIVCFLIAWVLRQVTRRIIAAGMDKSGLAAVKKDAEDTQRLRIKVRGMLHEGVR